MPIDLAPATHAGIVRENLRAAQAIHMAYMLEELRMYQVVDRVVELFKQGKLPIARGPVVQALATYAFDSTRLTEAQRRNIYARVFGASGGDAGAPGPNREFSALWRRFAASAAHYARDARPATLQWPRTAANVWVRRDANALALNLSRHCTGEAFTAAQELHRATDAQLRLLRDPQLLTAFGQRDHWQVIDRVNRQYLGGSADTGRVRTMARTGSTIIAWLATWADGTVGSFSDSADADEPSNDDLVGAVNEWLAGAGMTVDVAWRDTFGARAPSPPDVRAGDTEPVAPSQSTTSLHVFEAPVQRALDALAAAARAGTRVSALFRGPAGSGKTLAAQRLAGALARDLFHVHLSQIVSQHVGETEKNLDRVFAQAESSGSVLLFDEADALLGERAGANHGSDRYASAEAAYLLQRMEEFPGVAILEANLDAPIDESLLHDLRAVIGFSARRSV
jgi:hypothetical protein